MMWLVALGSSAGGADATSRLRTDRAPWTIRTERLIGRLPVSVSVTERGRLVYAHAGNVLQTPASDEKLLLSMALFDRFGADYRMSTTVEGPRPSNGLITRERWAPGWRTIALQFIALPTALVFDHNTSPGGFVFDPEARAAAALTADLRGLGVRVSGRARARPEPATAQSILATIRSAPLVDILRRQIVDSLNLDAEVLTKMLGAAVFGSPGSIAKGARAIQSWANRHGVEVVAHDGSGLSYTNSVSTDGVVRLLTAANTRPWGPSLRATLPTGGEGTLAARLNGLRVRAKTGTLLEQVSALSGWVWLQRPRRWAEFSILSRGLAKSQAVVLEDELVSTIAKHS